MTSENPVDHPHHNSVTVGADVFFVRLPALSPEVSELDEEATYNLYVNEVFQGRAPGRTWIVSQSAEELSDAHLRVVQGVEWQGPEEWGPSWHEARARQGDAHHRHLPGRRAANVIDVRSQLRPTEWDITIGPTRHAYFTVRLADTLSVARGGSVLDSEGHVGSGAVSGGNAAWVDMSWPAGHGRSAGIAVMPHPSDADLRWYVQDYGTMTLNPFLRTRGVLDRGDTLDLGIRLIVHDGDADEARVRELYEAFRRERG